MGPGGASQIAITLTSILAAAVDDQLIVRNPCKAQSVKLPRQPKSKVKPWTMAQAEEIRAGAARPLAGDRRLRRRARPAPGRDLRLRSGRGRLPAAEGLRAPPGQARGRPPVVRAAEGRQGTRGAAWRSACRSGWRRTSRRTRQLRSRCRGTSRATRSGTASRSRALLMFTRDGGALNHSHVLHGRVAARQERGRHHRGQPAPAAPPVRLCAARRRRRRQGAVGVPRPPRPHGDAADLRPPDALGRGPRAAGDRGGFRGG